MRETARQTTFNFNRSRVTSPISINQKNRKIVKGNSALRGNQESSLEAAVKDVGQTFIEQV